MRLRRVHGAAWPWFLLITLVCVGLSYLGLGVAYALRTEEIGGLGGAAAVVVSYFILFVRDAEPEELQKILSQPPLQPGLQRSSEAILASEFETLEGVGRRLRALEGQLDSTSRALSIQNRWLVATAVLGNAVWAIGQLIVHCCLAQQRFGPVVVLACGWSQLVRLVSAIAHALP